VTDFVYGAVKAIFTGRFVRDRSMLALSREAGVKGAGLTVIRTSGAVIDRNTSAIVTDFACRALDISALGVTLAIAVAAFTVSANAAIEASICAWAAYTSTARIGNGLVHAFARSANVRSAGIAVTCANIGLVAWNVLA